MTEGAVPIVFQNEAGTVQAEPSVLDEERERHRKRHALFQLAVLPQRYMKALF
jgi:hypothetical protein